MTHEEINSEVEKALAGDKAVLIEKYVTSDGVVKDYVVELLPDSGYKDMIKESLETLNKNPEEFLFNIRPSDADAEEWVTAVTEQINSFKNSLDPSSDKPAWTDKQVLTKFGSVLLTSSDSAPTVVIKNMRVLSSTVQTENVEEKLPKGNIPRYKHIIRSKLPISKYLPRLNLAPGKFTAVKSVSLH
jgi:hypothetical protein